MENDHTARSKVNCKVAEHGCRVRLKLQDIASDNCIEWTLEAQL
jgi:hypothetical protein